MQDEDPIAPGLGQAGADGFEAIGGNGGSTVDFLDAVHRAGFEAWWLRTHTKPRGSRPPAGDSDAVARSRSRAAP